MFKTKYFLYLIIFGMLTLQAADKNKNQIIINADLGTVKIDKNIYGGMGHENVSKRIVV